MSQDKVFKLILWVGSLCFFALLSLMVIFLLKGSKHSIDVFGSGFLTGKTWDPVGEEFGLLPSLVGTLLTASLALFLSLPFSISIGLLLGVYFKEGFLNKILTTTIELLAGIPSVIYGFWGLFFLAPIVRRIQLELQITPYGVGIFTASGYICRDTFRFWKL